MHFRKPLLKKRKSEIYDYIHSLVLTFFFLVINQSSASSKLLIGEYLKYDL